MSDTAAWAGDAIAAVAIAASVWSGRTSRVARRKAEQSELRSADVAHSMDSIAASLQVLAHGAKGPAEGVSNVLSAKGMSQLLPPDNLGPMLPRYTLEQRGANRFIIRNVTAVPAEGVRVTPVTDAGPDPTQATTVGRLGAFAWAEVIVPPKTSRRLRALQVNDSRHGQALDATAGRHNPATSQA